MTKNPITHFSSDLMSTLSERYNLSLNNEEKIIFSYLLTLLFSLAFVLKPDLSHFFTLTFPEPNYNLLIKNETTTDIRKFYTSFIQNYPFDSSMEPIKEEYLVDYTCSLIYTLLQMVKKPVIHIYLQITKDFTGKIFLEQKIFEIFTNNSVVITDDIRKSNLIISDTMEVPQDKIQVFFLENMHDSNQWKELLILLQKLLISQYF